jgi:hypothetical protein
MTFDSARGRVVLFGGISSSVWMNDTWEWDGNEWTQRIVTPSPAPRYAHAMAWDAVRTRTVLFSGRGAAADTWTWDGATWRQELPSTSPPARQSHAMASDIVRGRVVLFGGELFPNFTVRMPNARTPGSTARRTRQASRSLALLVPAAPARRHSPLDLTSAGLTGCTLYVSGDLVLPLAPSGGVALLPMPIPNDATLLGAELYNQAFVVDPPANPFGATASNGTAARIGGR